MHVKLLVSSSLTSLLVWHENNKNADHSMEYNERFTLKLWQRQKDEILVPGEHAIPTASAAANRLVKA